MRSAEQIELRKTFLNTSTARRLIFCLYKRNFSIPMNFNCLYLARVKDSLESSVLTYGCGVYLGKKRLLCTPYRRWWRYFSWIHTCLKNINPFYPFKSLFSQILVTGRRSRSSYFVPPGNLQFHLSQHRF